MKRKARRKTTRAVLGLLGALALGGTAASAADQPPQTKDCCFANWQYAGGCTVEIPEDESCLDILEVLNNPMSAHMGYCDRTQIRGGWVAVSCEHPPGGVYAGAPESLRPEEPPLELPPTMRKERLGTEEPGPGLRAVQPSYLTPVEPHALTPREPSDIVLGPGYWGW